MLAEKSKCLRKIFQSHQYSEGKGILHKPYSAAESCSAETMQKLYRLFSVCIVIFHMETTEIIIPSSWN